MNIPKYIYIPLIVLAVVYGLFAAGKFIYASYVSDSIGLKSDEKVLGEGEIMRYIAVGDSIAVGLGASAPENTLAYGLLEFLKENHRVIYKNIAKEGAQTEDLIEEQLDEAIGFDPDIVIITIGGNDAVRLNPPQEILKNYKTITERLKEETGATVYISNIPKLEEADIFPDWHRKLIREKYKGFNDKLLELEDERVRIVDITSGWDEIKDKSSVFAKDRFHPNDLGYQFWIKAFLDRMKEDINEG